MIMFCDWSIIEPLEWEFEKIDLDRSGLITFEELKIALEKCKIKVNNSDLQEIINNLKLKED